MERDRGQPVEWGGEMVSGELSTWHLSTNNGIYGMYLWCCRIDIEKGERMEHCPGPRLPISKPETDVLKLKLMSWILHSHTERGT